MKRILASAAVLLAGCSQESFRIEAPAAPAWTSLPLTVEDGRPHVEVTVNGHSLWLLLDTGAEATIWLNPDAAHLVRARFTGLHSMHQDAYGNTFRRRNFILDECRLGDFTLRDMDGRECVSAEPGVQGIIGWRILERFRVLVDYPGKRLMLGWKSEYPGVTTAWTRIAFRATACGIATDAVCDGKAVELVWDTGANRMILKEGRFPKSGDEKAGFRYEAKSVRIGDREFGPYEFVILDLSQPPGDGLVGHDLFQKHRVLIDWESSTLLVD